MSRGSGESGNQGSGECTGPRFPTPDRLISLTRLICNACKPACLCSALSSRARVRGPGARRARSTTKNCPSRHSCRPSKPRSRPWIATRWIDLLSPTADRDQALEFFDAMVPQGITRVVVKERDRSALQGTLPGEGYRLVVEVFMETGPRGRIATWRLDIRRPRGDDIGRQPWRILAEDRLASIEGLHRLALHPEKQFAAQQPRAQGDRFRAAAAGGRCVRRRNAGGRDRDRAGRRRHDGVPAGAEGREGPAEAVRGHRDARDAVHHGLRPHQPVRIRAARRRRRCWSR